MVPPYNLVPFSHSLTPCYVKNELQTAKSGTRIAPPSPRPFHVTTPGWHKPKFGPFIAHHRISQHFFCLGMVYNIWHVEAPIKSHFAINKRISWSALDKLEEGDLVAIEACVATPFFLLFCTF